MCVCMCVCFNLGCSNAELLSLHRSSSHTWCFWGCRWRLSTSFSVPHPPNHLTWFSLCVFFFCSLLVAVHHLPHFTSPFRPSVDFCFVLFFYVLLQDVGLSSGIACFRPFSCQFITILLVFISVSLSSLFSCVPPPQGRQHALLHFMSIMLFYPQVPSAMSPNASSHQLTGLSRGKVPRVCELCES